MDLADIMLMMMKQHLLHPLWPTIRVTLIVLCLAALASACSTPDQAQLRNIQGLVAAGQLDVAKAAAEHLVSNNPRLAQGYFLLGQIAEQQQHFPEAFSHYSNALKWDPDHFAVRLRLGKIFLLGNDFAKAQGMAQYVLEFRPGNVEAKTLLAAVMARSGNVAVATQRATEIVTHAPGNTEAVLLLAGLFAKQGKLDQAEQLLVRTRALNPTNVALLLAMANNSMAQNQPEQAVAHLSAMTTLEPRVFAHWARLAEFHERRSQIVKAEEVWRDAVRAFPTDEPRLLAQAQFFARNGMLVRAEQTLLIGLQNRPSATSLTVELANLYARTQRWVLAEPFYHDLVSRPMPEAQKTKMKEQLALALVELRRHPEAELLVSTMLKADPMNTHALLLRGKIALARGQANAAIEDFRAVLTMRGDSPETFSLLINAYVLNNQGELAKEGLRWAMRVDPNNRNAHWQYAQLLLALKEFPAALVAVREFIQTTPNDTKAVDAAIHLFIQHQAWQEAQALTPLFGRDTLLSTMARGRIYVAQKQWAKAEREFAAVLRQEPNHVEAFSMSIRVLLSQGKLQTALARLQTADAIAPATGFIENLRGETYVLLKQWELAESNFRQAIKLNPNFAIPYKNLARVYAGRDDYAAAVTLLRLALKDVFDPELSGLLAENLRHREQAKIVQ